MQASRLSRGPSPARAGTDRASSGCGAARSHRLCRKRPMCRQHQTTSDASFGRPSRIRLALHKVLSSAMGSEDHEACRSQAPTLRDLHPQIDRAQSRSRIQLARCPEGSLLGYVKSQSHEGWRLVPDRYDDGGLSGASLDRPALQNLLASGIAGMICIKSSLAQAIRYATSRWDALTRFADDGRLEMSNNNAAERAIRPIALGRKNYLFAC